jgi:hypothetical protein
MNILLVEPDYYSRFPPLGLMKLASYHRSRGNNIKFIRGTNNDLNFYPDKILITSLFTYAWSPVHNAIEFYHNLYPDSSVEVGGIYASIMPDRIRSIYPYARVHVGLYDAAEHYMPAYDILSQVKKWEKWDASIIFSSRGCIRKCPFCVVPRLEGMIRPCITDIQNYVYPGHKRIILWDNNFFASPNWKNVLQELNEVGLKVDFNQGLDARLIDDEKARMLADLKMPLLRMAYDYVGDKINVANSVELLSEYGVRRRNIFIYTLYNFFDSNNPQYNDTPEIFLTKIKSILELGCVAYPMRFEPNNSLKKNQFISPNWTREQLETIADARRVIGYGGAFPPYEGLVKKLNNSIGFHDAFGLRPAKEKAGIADI